MEPENKAAEPERKLRISKKARRVILALCTVLLLAAGVIVLHDRMVKKVIYRYGLYYGMEYYSISGKLQKTDYYGCMGDKLSSVVLTYGENGMLSKESYYDPDGVLQGWYAYMYDGEGRLTREARCLPDGSEEWWTEYTYDNEGNKKSKLFRTADGRKYDWYEYECDSRGNVIREKRYSGDGSLERDIEYAYDDCGNVIQETTGDSVTTYQYDKKGNRTEYKQYKNGSLFSWSEYLYDRKDNCVKEIILKPDGSISFWYEYEYDRNGNVLKRTEYSGG